MDVGIHNTQGSSSTYTQRSSSSPKKRSSSPQNNDTRMQALYTERVVNPVLDQGKANNFKEQKIKQLSSSSATAETAHDPKSLSSMEDVVERVLSHSLEQGKVDSDTEQKVQTLEPPTRTPLSYAAVATKATERIIHQNGVFGAYVLHDPVALSRLVAINDPNTATDWACFNYEQVSELREDPDLREAFDQNLEFLRQEQAEGKITYSINYQDRSNNLLEPTGAFTWRQDQRLFTKTMIFFNPYLATAELTSQVIHTFFHLAKCKLYPNGAVIFGWNPDRKDRMKGIKVISIAQACKFTIIAELSAKKFAELTGFQHKKNSVSLQRAQDKNESTTVAISESDKIFIFRKSDGGDPTADKTNHVVQALLAQLK